MWFNCMQHDDLPRRCDYLIDALTRVKATHLLLLIVMTVLWAAMLTSDLDQADVTLATLVNRARRLHPVYRRWPLRIYGWVLPLCLKIIVPASIAAVTLILLLTTSGGDSLSALNIILNYLAIGFLSEFDDVLARALLPTHVLHAAGEAARELDAAEEDFLHTPVSWLGNRLLCFTLAACMPAHTLYVEHAMRALSSTVDTFFATRSGGTLDYTIVACENFIGTVITSALLMGLLTSTLWALFESPGKGGGLALIDWFPSLVRHPRLVVRLATRLGNAVWRAAFLLAIYQASQAFVSGLRQLDMLETSGNVAVYGDLN